MLDFYDMQLAIDEEAFQKEYERYLKEIGDGELSEEEIEEMYQTQCQEHSSL